MGAGEFRIIVENENKLICQCPGSIVDQRFERTSPEDKRAFELARRTIAVFNSWLSADKASDRDTMSVIGSHMYTLLFPHIVDELFRAALRERRQRQDPAPLRVVLEFKPEAAWLAELPWEFLYLPETPDEPKGFFLSTKNDLILTRTVRLNVVQLGAPRLGRAARILLVLSEPLDEQSVSDALVAELQKLHDNTGAVEVRSYLRVGSGAGRVKGPTRKDLAAWLKDPEFQPDIVHFVGHGCYSRGSDPRMERGELALVRPDDGNADWCSDEAFADMFDEERLPKVVFLHACDSSKTTSYRGFKGVAQALIKLGVPNVVAMQYPVENVVATRFATSFYQALLGGVPIDTAVQRGRNDLGMQLHELAKEHDARAEHFNNRRFGSPVVFVQQWLGLSLFGHDDAAEPGGGGGDDIDLSSECACPYAKCKSFHARDSRFCEQGYGPLQTCVSRSCRRLMKQSVPTCPYCGTAQPGDARVSRPASVAPSAGGTRLAAADRFRAAAESSAVHGSAALGRASGRDTLP